MIANAPAGPFTVVTNQLVSSISAGKKHVIGIVWLSDFHRVAGDSLKCGMKWGNDSFCVKKCEDLEVPLFTSTIGHWNEI